MQTADVKERYRKKEDGIFQIERKWNEKKTKQKTPAAIKKHRAGVVCEQVRLQSNKGQTAKPSPASLLQPRLTLHSCVKEREKLIQPI